MPRSVKIDELSEGQILAVTLTNKYDQVLIKKGTMLNSDTHIRVLKMWGISEVSIFDDISDANSIESNSDEKLKIETQILDELNWIIKNENDKFIIDLAILSQLEGNNNE